MSYYDDLRVSSSASAVEIENAYQQLLEELDADKNRVRREESVQRIKQAYNVLRNQRLRSDYDERLRAKSKAGGSGVLATRQRPEGEGRLTDQSTSKTSADEPRPKHKGFLTLTRTLLLLAIGAAILIGAAVYTVSIRPKEGVVSHVAAEKKKNAEAEIEAANAEIAAGEAKRAREQAKLNAERGEAQKKQDAAIAKAKLHNIHQEGETVIESLRALSLELNEWEAKILPLRTNEQGRAIAADDDRIVAFEAAWSKMRFKKADGKAIHERIKALLAPVNAELAKEEPVWEPSPSILKQLAEEKEAIDAKTAEIRKIKRQIELLGEEASRQGKMASLTLEDAIPDLAARKAKELNDIETAGAKRIQEEKAKQAEKLAAEQVELEKSSGAQNSEDAKLKARAKSPGTKALLAFFLTKGYVQPIRQVMPEKRPISYSKLEAYGALIETTEGQTRLLEVLLDYSDKDRPLWKEGTTSVADLSPPKHDKLIKIQKALIELGPYLVEEKLMDP